MPLWRKDIQYDFLRHVFEDDKKVFHKASDKSTATPSLTSTSTPWPRAASAARSLRTSC